MKHKSLSDDLLMISGRLFFYFGGLAVSGYFRRIFSIGLPLASSSTSLSR